MTAVTAPPAEIGGPGPAGEAIEPQGSGRSLGWWGTVWLIATESMIFAVLLFGNFYLRAKADHWPLGGIADPELKISGIRSVLLIGSSLPMHLGDRAIQEGRRVAMLVGLGVGWVMGSLFLAGHVYEYVTLWSDFKPSTNAYGSVFYTITGFHALHLSIGMVAIAYIWIRGLLGHYDAGRHDAVQNTVLYWHFVDAVWVFVFSSLYLSVSWP